MALLVVALPALGLQTAFAQDICENNYGSCMASCATDPLAARCMQRCGTQRARCPSPVSETSKPAMTQKNATSAISGVRKSTRPVVRPAARMNASNQQPWNPARWP